MRPGAYARARSAFASPRRGLDEETREVEVALARTEALFILGRVGQPFYRRSGAKVPFDPPGGAVGVTLRLAAREAISAMRQIETELGGAVERLELRAPRLIVVHVEPARVASIVRELRQRPEVLAAGPVAYDAPHGAAFFTGSVVVQLEPGQEGAATGLAERHGLVVERKLTLPGFVMMTLDDPDLNRLLAASEALSQEPGVRSAEPELAYSLEYDAVTPTDELVDEQWHLTLSRLPDAWQRMRDEKAGIGGKQRKVPAGTKPKATGISPHVLRHTAATHMARRGAPHAQKIVREIV
jgi:hypothetical protein